MSEIGGGRMTQSIDDVVEPLCQPPELLEWLDGHIDGFWEKAPEHYWLTKVRDEITRLRSEVERLEQDRRRYQWLADAVLYCDYGDNNHGGLESPDRIGWGIRLTRRNAEPFIFGQSIDAAIDAALTHQMER